MRTTVVAALVAGMMFTTSNAVKAQLFGGTLGHLINQLPKPPIPIPDPSQLNKAAGDAVKAVDQNVTQPVVAGVNHAATETVKQIDRNVTQPAAGGFNHFLGEVDKGVFQPIGRGWTHFWHELDLIGKLKDAGHELIADANDRAANRIDQVAARANTMEKSTVKDVTSLLRKAMSWLFLVLAGAGTIIVVAARFKRPRAV